MTSGVRKPLIEQFPKGKAVSVWVNPQLLVAFDKALDAPDGARIKEGSYALEALTQRLTREGFIRDDESAAVAAQAFELSKSLGPEAVRAKLSELAQEAAAAAGVAGP